VARSLRGINRSVTVLVETSSHSSDSTSGASTPGCHCVLPGKIRCKEGPV
jgi:hypothetical protein